MKLSLLLCALLLSAAGWCASGVSAGPKTQPDSANIHILGTDPGSKALRKPLRERRLYSRGRGTMGL
jgi:hypothetical protein